MASTERTDSLTDSDKAAVAGLTQRMVAAWSGHDADAFADLFVEDGTMILPGVFRAGREEIRAFMAAAFQAEYKGSQVTGQPLHLRFLGPDVAVLLTEGGVLAPGDTEVTSARAIRATWLATKRDGQWRLAGYQNSPRN
ncbi:SgcJ/EcaC family oxidoreductase [Dactylosporangium sp. NPDC051484]|uniref:SgcJ/EcaC family oxidoreductase n=1 Tax=Dactylosporangium sp. NPDC051484 TaxID=3154942 RepID=UPI003450D1ED